MKQKDKIILFLILAIVIFIILKSLIQFVFWYYPKNCIFFEFDFSKQCISNNWDYTINGNIEKTKETIEKSVNNYIEHKTEKLERKLENIQKNINTTDIKTNPGNGDLDIEIIKY